MKTLFIEGIPGSGKTTTAERITALFNQSGKPACWYREESNDHPIHPRSLKQFRDSPDFIHLCLKQWRRFTDSALNENRIHVFEGSAFQSTVRFMVESELKAIQSYVLAFAEIIKPLEPRFVYLRPQDVQQFSESVLATRGDEWGSKVAGYLESTTFCQSHGLRGYAGMHTFWEHYANVCDALVPQLEMPTLTTLVDATNREASFKQVRHFLYI